ncbi:carboxypeptidase-like regulatory domain-containing protein [Gaetbulibacter aestuarii]|uniref:Carboxypeptidase-like regulatory domain-containing protein n=1 Tax=Gaetbulibacter aestuarii TaxID=1502358 RepID=A0ABW7N1R7_9FLAO
MKKKTILKFTPIVVLLFFTFFRITAQETQAFKEVKGVVIDRNTKDPLMLTDLAVKESNITTITNSDGEFLLKIPSSQLNGTLIISRLGYIKQEIPISDLTDEITIALSPAVTQLKEIEIASFKNAKSLFDAVMDKRGKLYNVDNTLMTAFYRETIRKRRRDASLSEAVLLIHRRPNVGFRRDGIELVKARKSTDYSRLDTLALKLQGGPFSNLYTDIVRYPEYIFDYDDISSYDFSFGKSTQINDTPVYVINFKQKREVVRPLYYGKLYIDASSLALIKADYRLNVENKELTSRMYVRKKPRRVDVYPTEAHYTVTYRNKGGSWQFAYSNIDLTFKVNWKGRLFNSVYNLKSEMAITDWKLSENATAKNDENILRPSTVLVDKASGFSDPRFWGEYNIIEPEKSIESAIKKIQRQLERS